MNFINRIFQNKPPEISIEKRDLKKILPPNPVILEAGVCDGLDTEEFARVFPDGQIYGFECLPHYFELAAKHLEKYPNVRIYPFALNNHSCELDFYVSTRKGQFYGSGSILKPKLHKEVHPEILFEEKIRVQAITIDDWAAKYNIAKVDFFWLDLQGAEIKALEGAEKILMTTKAIFTEVSLIETYQNVPLYLEIKSFLYSKGFKIHREFLPFKDMGNVLFLK